MAKKRVVKASAGFADRIGNLVPSRDIARDWTIQDALSAGAFGAPAALPPKVDLRKSWWTINNQANTGSCVGWATAVNFEVILLQGKNDDPLSGFDRSAD